jgi:LysM repeat protein
MFAFGLLGCEEEKKEDMTKWPIPLFEKTEEESGTVYYVVEGDTISLIAAEYGVSPLHLAVENNLELEGRRSIIYPGDRLVIPKN